MNYSGQQGGRSFLLGSHLSSAVRMLIAWNVILFLVQLLMPGRLEAVLGLVPRDVLSGQVWQLVSYMFLHSTHGLPLHLFFNMLLLWMFGSEIEGQWGTRRFLQYYFFTGIGAGLTNVLVAWAAHENTTTIGASGAVYGLLLAYGMMFPNRPILLYMLIPIPAKYFVIILGVLELLFSRSQDGVAHFAHLGGLLFGWIYLKGFPGGKFRGFRKRRPKQQFRVLEFRSPDDESRR